MNNFDARSGKRDLGTFCSVLAMAAVVGGFSATASAQDAADDEAIEEIVTIGTRVRGRSVTETPVPVDIITAASLRKNGQIETARLLRNLAPSFNYYESTISDGTDILRPATLRGLGPDQTLVLVNGKRHVGFPWVGIGQTVNRGSTGVDFNSIPASGLQRIEILRDGASSQYGSDAIAGVINMQLKETVGESVVTARWGSTYEGDGDQWSISANTGIALGDGGFANMTVEVRDINRTNRAAPSTRAGKVVMRIGDTAISDNYNLALNTKIPLTESVEAYAFGIYATRKGLSGGFYRWPFQSDRTVLQVFPDGFLPLQTSKVEDATVVGGLRFDFADNWHGDVGFNWGRNEFGFGARNTVNVSIAAQFRERNPGATDAEIAANAGPTEGFSGAAVVKQAIVSADFTGELDVGFADTLYTAVGMLWRREDYSLIAGDLASFSCGSSAAKINIPSMFQDLSVGAANFTSFANCGFQGFPGYSSEVAGSISRDNVAVYLDMETNLTPEWLVTGAVRYEAFENTSDRLTGKISTRGEIAPGFAIRGAAQTGFRAPSLPQLRFTSITTSAGAAGLTQTLLAPNTDPFTRAIGVAALDLETSKSFSIGFVWDQIENLTLTVDAYQIDIDDRIVLSGTLNEGQLRAEGNDAAANILAAAGIGQAQVFTNAIDTRTRGLDVVATYISDFGGGTLTSSLALSVIDNNVQKVRDVGNLSAATIFNRADVINVEKSAPSTRVTATLDWIQDNFGALVRLNYFGATESGFFGFANPAFPAGFFVGVLGTDPADVRKTNDAFIVDFELSYDLNDNIQFSIGADNAFDKKPNKVPNNSISRLISDGVFPPAQTFGNFKFPWRGPAYGLNGGFYYFRTTIRY